MSYIVTSTAIPVTYQSEYKQITTDLLKRLQGFEIDYLTIKKKLILI